MVAVSKLLAFLPRDLIQIGEESYCLVFQFTGDKYNMNIPSCATLKVLNDDGLIEMIGIVYQRSKKTWTTWDDQIVSLIHRTA